MAGMRWEWAYVIASPCGGNGRALGPRDPRPPGARLQRVHGRAAIPLPDHAALATPPPAPARAGPPAGPMGYQSTDPAHAEAAGTGWASFVEELRQRWHTGPSAEDPYWLAIGLPHGVARERFIAEQRRHGVDERLIADTTILVGLISGATISLQAALRGPIRHLRLQVAECLVCCVGQVQLLLEVTCRGHPRFSEIGQRLEEHFNCGHAQIAVASGGVEHATIRMKDRHTLCHYGFLRGQAPAGRVLAILTPSDATGHVERL